MLLIYETQFLSKSIKKEIQLIKYLINPNILLGNAFFVTRQCKMVLFAVAVAGVLLLFSNWSLRQRIEPVINLCE